MRDNARESIGQRFGRLVVENIVGRDGNGKPQALCLCDCGRQCEASLPDIRRGKIKSCGCLQTENRIKHGQAKTKIYAVWSAMIDRCRNPKNKHYGDYGGRGIVVCERWTDFENFLADMGEAPTGMSIDRINNEGNYEPGNCKWSTSAQQNRNLRRNRLITFNGQTKTVMDWSTDYGMTFMQLWSRLYRLNWPIEKALLTPVAKRRTNA